MKPMRILVAIPHFYKAKDDAFHGSEQLDSSQRIDALKLTLITLRQTFGSGQVHMENLSRVCNGLISAELDIVVCTTRDDHLMEAIPDDLCLHRRTGADPKFLGYECHRVLLERLDSYDYFCFLEDDILVSDPLFFWKIAWFSKAAGPEAVLQPNRFELSSNPPVYKLYIDGPLIDQTISPRFQDRSINPFIKANVLGNEVVFERVDNPHAGCFFLTSEQMRVWSRKPYFLDQSADFWGPLESAATLGVMRTFRTYKAAAQNAGFLEVRHLDARYLGKRLQFSAR